MDPTAYFHDSTDDALQNEVVVPLTRCPLDADSFTIFEASMSEVQGRSMGNVSIGTFKQYNRLKRNGFKNCAINVPRFSFVSSWMSIWHH